MIFQSHVLRGLGIPTFDFFRGLLHHWAIQAHHLTPNSIRHISIFVHLCEAFLGIEPHFDLFKLLFHLKPHPSESEVDVVGGAGLQLRQGVGPKYIPYKMSDKVIDWKDLWFYVENQSPSLPHRSVGPLVKKASWNSKGGNIDQVNFLLGEIDLLKKKNKISGASVVAHWSLRTIQPLQRRVHLGFQFTGEEDPTSYTRFKISNADLKRRVDRLLKGVTGEASIKGTFKAGKHPLEVLFE
jgi:hypothetical protein